MRSRSLCRLFREEPFKYDLSVYDLSQGEAWWRERNSLLESRGYRLRDRLRPGWVPSFSLNPLLRPEDCEDAVGRTHPYVTDAMRISEGKDVIIKKVRKGSGEKDIATFLSSITDPTNHCVPITDSFEDHREERVEFLVMPLLRRFNCPPFRAIDEVVDFIKQTLEGIVFIHSNHVAHRDCSDLNIMLDAGSMCPDGFHPALHTKARDWKKGRARFKNRSDCPDVKYFFTDFGLSTRFEDDDEERLVTGAFCQVDVPELSDTVPYDPFAVDIYLLGDVYKRAFIEEYSNVQFLKPLVESMTRTEPSERPKAKDALKQLDDIVSRRSKASLRWRLIKFDTGRVSRFLINTSCITRGGALAAKRMIGRAKLIGSACPA